MIDSRFFFQRNFEILSHQAFACTLISCCSIVNDPRGFLRYSVPCFAQPEHYITSFPICQGVFQKFFKNFFQPLFSRSGSARVLYHILSRLSRGFSKVFSTFFVILFEAVSRGRPLVDSLHIIALSFSFVNRFLQSFLGLELRADSHKSSGF